MLEKINLRECGTCNLCCKLPAINEKDLKEIEEKEHSLVKIEEL